MRPAVSTPHTSPLLYLPRRLKFWSCSGIPIRDGPDPHPLPCRTGAGPGGLTCVHFLTSLLSSPLMTALHYDSLIPQLKPDFRFISHFPAAARDPHTQGVLLHSFSGCVRVICGLLAVLLVIFGLLELLSCVRGSACAPPPPGEPAQLRQAPSDPETRALPGQSRGNTRARCGYLGINR